MQWLAQPVLGGGTFADTVAALQAASIGLGRIVALCYSSSTLYQIHKHIRCLYY